MYAMSKKLSTGTHYKAQDAFQLFLPRAISPKPNRFVKSRSLFNFRESDNRPFIEVKLLDHPIVGLLDSGSNATILGKGGDEIIKCLNLKIFKPNTDFVHTADDEKQLITGIVHLPIVIDEECHIIETLVVPSLKHVLIFGSDFCERFAIKIDYLEGSWSVQRKNVCLLASDSPPDFKIKVNNLHSLCSDQQAIAADLLKSFEEISSSKRLGRTNKITLTIDTGDAKPFRLRQYPMSPYMMKQLNKELDEMLSLGVVEPSNSPWCSPVILVKKRCGEYRFCFDGRRLNEMTKHDSYPLPRIDRI